MPTKWGLAFAQSKSFLCRRDSNGKVEILEFKLRTDKGEILEPSQVIVGDVPVLELFQPGDELYCEMGGRNGPFLARLINERENVKIFQIPIAKLQSLNGDEAIGGKEEEEDKDFGADFESKKETSRKARALEILRLSEESPQSFYGMLATDPSVWRVLTYISTYTKVQKDDRIKAQQRKLMRRTDFLWLPDRLGDKRVVQARELLSRDTDINYYLALEKAMLRGIESELSNIPIWTEFLGKIPGFGPSIGGRLIGSIRDIRRFPERGGFRAYASYSVVDGKMPRFQRKKEDGSRGPTYNTGLRQALFLAGDQIVKQGDDNPYNIWYLRGKAKYWARQLYSLETEKEITDESQAISSMLEEASKPGLSPKDVSVTLALAKGFFDKNPKVKRKMKMIHCYRMAIRFAASRFVNDLWKEWWRIVEKQGEPLPQSVRDVLYPRPPLKV